MATASDRPGSGWSPLEQSFFDTAPPDVAVMPPPAPTFDDLGPVLPERRKRPRVARPRQAAPTPSRGGRARNVLGAWRAALVALIAALGRRLRPTLARLRAAGAAAARDGWRRLTASARRAKETSRPALRAAASRFLDGLPGERPDGQTVLTTVVAIVVLCGLSATVLGSRGPGWLPPSKPPATVIGSTP